MGAAGSFLARQLFITPKPADPSRYGLRGQTGLVTGSNTGLGFEASKQLLGLGLSKLILAVRNQQKGDEARRKLAGMFPGAEIEVSIVDMDSYSSIQQFVARCETLPRLDFAILNAGVVKFGFEPNKYTGHEQTIQINVLSTALLASLLLPVVANKSGAGPGKVSIVGSEVAEFAQYKERNSPPVLGQFDVAKTYDGTERYNVSKLLLQYYIIEAAKRISPHKVILNVSNPGFCYGSELHRDVPGMTGRILGAVKRTIGRTCEVGARPIVKAAVVEGKESHGKFYQDNGVAKLAPLTRGPEGAKYSREFYGEIINELKQYNVEQAIASVGLK